MNTRRFLVEAAALIGAAVLCALVSNALAARERKLALVGYYPNAQKVPAQTTETAAVTATATTATTVPTTTIVVPTATTATTATAAPKTPTASATTTAALAPPPKKPDVARFVVHPDKAYVEIKYDDVKALHDAGALFLDA